MTTPKYLSFALRSALVGGACLLAPAALADTPPPAPRSPDDAVACADAASAVERRHRFPLAVLRAVALAESGRPDEEKQAKLAWPWTVTADGAGRFFATKSAAIAHVRALQRDGVRNIDVGCMQVNLMYHPDAFESLDLAFDPARNAAYAGDFLARLFDRSRSWSRAVALYHSADRDKGLAYWRRVEQLWNAERSRLLEEVWKRRIRAFRARRDALLLRRR